MVQEAVHTAKENGFVKVLVTGHTDTVGSDSYNQALSVRRAQSVKDEMIREGLDGSGIRSRARASTIRWFRRDQPFASRRTAARSSTWAAGASKARRMTKGGPHGPPFSLAR